MFNRLRLGAKLAAVFILVSLIPLSLVSVPSSAPLRIQVLSFRGLAFRAGW